MKPIRHYYPAGFDVEVGTATRRNPRPGFRWVRGYVEALPDGSHGQAEPRRHIARGDVIHRTEAAARAALAPVSPSPQ